VPSIVRPAVVAVWAPAVQLKTARWWTGSSTRRYDAAQAIQSFSARLRDQIDLDTLTSELVAVVQQTMQPTQASIWLR
jgi:hypothetical protein